MESQSDCIFSHKLIEFDLNELSEHVRKSFQQRFARAHTHIRSNGRPHKSKSLEKVICTLCMRNLIN